MSGPSIVSAFQVKPGTMAAVIPKPIWEKLGIGKGDDLLVYESDGTVIMVPMESLRHSRRGKALGPPSAGGEISRGGTRS